MIFIVTSIILFLILYLNIPRVNYGYDELTDTYYISSAKGNLNEYTIPNYFKGKKVTKIGVRAFENSSIKNIYFENDSNIETIDRRAFYNSKLVSIKLPLSLKYVNQNAFSYSYNLEEVEFNLNSNISLGASAFFECKALKKVVLPLQGNVIGTFAFFNCISLHELKLPKNADIKNEILYNVSAKIYYYSSNILDQNWLLNSNCEAIKIDE